jgi:poly(3-hydroxybutyrate) depolymerase
VLLDRSLIDKNGSMNFLICLGILVFVAPVRLSAADSSVLAPGAGQFIFSHRDGATNREIKIWTYRPKTLTAEALVLFVMHGAERNGTRYRQEWQPYAERAQAVLLVPEFSAAGFPGSRNYSAPRDHSGDADGATPFAFAAIEEIFDRVVAANKLTANDYRLYGHSAGAQFVHRFILSQPAARVRIAVAANAGWYMMPEFNVDFPHGLRSSGVTESGLKAAFGRKFFILLGEKDTDPNHPQLNRSKAAMRQGTNRLERGQRFFRTAEAQAEKLGATFNWQLRTVANVAHSNAGIARAAAPLLLQ